KGGAEYSTDRLLNIPTDTIIDAIHSALLRFGSRRNYAKDQLCRSGSDTTSMVALRIRCSVSNQRDEAWDCDCLRSSALERRPFGRCDGCFTTGAAAIC